MSHKRVRGLLSSYLDGQVSRQEREQVEAHLATCADCRRYHDELRATVLLVRGLPQAPLPRSFTLAQAPRQRMAWALPSWGAPLATATAAALFAVLVLGEAAGLIGSPVARPAAMPATDTPPIEALKQAEIAPQPTPTVGAPLGMMGVQGEATPSAKQEPTPSPTNTPVPTPSPTVAPPPPPEEASQPPLRVPLLPWLQGGLGLLAFGSGAWWLLQRRTRR